MSTDTALIVEELRLIRKELHELRQDLADEDPALTEEEFELLREAISDVAKGRYKTADQLLRELTT